MLTYLKKKLNRLRYHFNNMSHLPMGLLLLCLIVVALSTSCSVLNEEKPFDLQTPYYDDGSKANTNEDIIQERDIIKESEEDTDIVDISDIPLPTPTITPELLVEPTPTNKAKPTIEPSQAVPDEPLGVRPEPTRIPKEEVSTTPTKNTFNSKYTKEASDIISEIINPDMDDVEKVKAVHDYIVINTKYDIEGLNNNTSPSSFTEEGVLIKGKAVCQGYAEAFQLFMELLDINSKIVTGTDKITGIGHAWNMVSLYDKWYHIDVTWDDPVPDQGDRIGYSYFLLRDEDMEDDHQWTKSNYPKCNSSDYLYYIYEDFIIDSVDNIEVKFMEQYDKGIREITLLYPENEMPDFSFMHNYDYLWVEDRETGGLKIDYSYYPLWRRGDYYVLTVIMP